MVTFPPYPAAMSAPDTHDAYLAPLPADQRQALQALRAYLAPLPDATEVISYAMPGYRLGKRIVALRRAEIGV